MTSSPDGAWRRAPVLRVIVAIGPTRVLRLIVAVILAGAWLTVILQIRPDLARPMTFGSDTSNYYAAGLRLAAGHPLYALGPGDRPVPADSPPAFSAPLLSPPPIAVLWRWLSLLPGPAIVALWWLGGVVLTSTVVARIVARAPWPGVLVVGVLAYPLSVIAFSGNVNAYLLPTMLVAWGLTRGPGATERSVAIAGFLALVGAAIKLTPVFVLWWILWQARHRPRSVGSIGVAGIALGLLVLATAGIGSLSDYLAVGRATADLGATDMSPAALLRLLGASTSLAAFGPIAVGSALAIGVVLTRTRPRLSFALAIAGMVFASPVVRIESLGLLVVAIAPWLEESGAEESPGIARWRMPRMAPLAAGAGAVLVVGTIALAAGTANSHVVIRNATNDQVVVRFVEFASHASYGFEVPGGGSGVAWADMPGGPDGSIVALDATCHVLAVSAASAAPTIVTITAGGTLRTEPDTTPGALASAGAALDYSSRCAAAVLAPLGP